MLSFCPRALSPCNLLLRTATSSVMGVSSHTGCVAINPFDFLPIKAFLSSCIMEIICQSTFLDLNINICLERSGRVVIAYLLDLRESITRFEYLNQATVLLPA